MSIERAVTNPLRNFEVRSTNEDYARLGFDYRMHPYTHKECDTR